MTAAHSSSRTGSAPAYIDTTKASIARVYDTALGGKDNYPADREVVEKLKVVAPEIEQFTVDHRAFLVRVVRFLAGQAGIDQFLDLGSGLPTAENTHQAAQRLNAEARVVYVDNDPTVVAHGRALLEENDRTFFSPGDLTHPQEVLEDPVVTRNLDVERPIALLQLGTLHHYDESELSCAEIMKQYVDALPSGSYVALSHFLDPQDEDSVVARRMEDVFLHSPLGTGRFRTREQILAMMPGLELVDPGLELCVLWWPDGPMLRPLVPAQRCIAGVVGRKP
ncbi:SAM-dependent methyltransferase [Actinomycetospora straminea]|uniref:SAM-dependent methyltransferase n=1 Tax=Actinomycetospora straminea TaxID=663607 RepID=A0ABP9DUT9_9PSEU|nr:SAM-dependent methyltransferase [Actinomycetospora straminea]MDD7935198.1 SAM-dependent methyltransferase [Actinomycetospora straminea]